MPIDGYNNDDNEFESKNGEEKLIVNNNSFLKLLKKIKTKISCLYFLCSNNSNNLNYHNYSNHSDS